MFYYIIKHEKYNKSSLNFDLAIIKLKESVVLDNYGQIACLPDETDILIQSDYLADNVSAVALGWEYFYVWPYIWSEFHQNILSSKRTMVYSPSPLILPEYNTAGVVP